MKNNIEDRIVDDDPNNADFVPVQNKSADKEKNITTDNSSNNRHGVSP